MAIKRGTHLANSLTGTAAQDFIYGFFGNDTLKGLGGNDSIFGGLGNDRLDGGAGDDRLEGGAGADTILGGAGNDIIDSGGQFLFGGTGDTAADKVDAGIGDDVVSIGKKDVALGGAGKDTLVINDDDFSVSELINVNFASIGSSTAKAIGAAGTGYATTKAGQFEKVDFFGFAKAGSKIIGSNGDDSLSLNTDFAATSGVSISGGAGDDRMSGSSQNDRLKGDAGNDVLNGERGVDTLTGGAGNDVFAFNSVLLSSADADKITDFSLADDIITIGVADNTNFGSGASLLLKGANPLNGTTASGIAQILYSTASGLLSIDLNGSDAGGIVEIATPSQLSRKGEGEGLVGSIGHWYENHKFPSNP
jgi:Ca2+-binding RTX toxin-like protein